MTVLVSKKHGTLVTKCCPQGVTPMTSEGNKTKRTKNEKVLSLLLLILRDVGCFHFPQAFHLLGHLICHPVLHVCQEKNDKQQRNKKQSNSQYFSRPSSQETVLTRQQLRDDKARFDRIIFHYIQHGQPVRTLYNNHGYQIHHIQCHWWLYWIVTHIFVDIF